MLQLATLGEADDAAGAVPLWEKPGAVRRGGAVVAAENDGSRTNIAAVVGGRGHA